MNQQQIIDQLVDALETARMYVGVHNRTAHKIIQTALNNAREGGQGATAMPEVESNTGNIIQNSEEEK